MSSGKRKGKKWEEKEEALYRIEPGSTDSKGYP